MAKLALAFLQILLLTGAVLTKSTNVQENGMIYIGQFNENDYYVSANAATWGRANTDCQMQLGGLGHLVGIETEAEWDFLTIALESNGLGTTYWTSGMYDPTRSVWRWTRNDLEFGAFAPWDAGFPSSPNELLRVLIYYTNRYDSYWRTIPGTQLHRYICEINDEH